MHTSKTVWNAGVLTLALAMVGCGADAPNGAGPAPGNNPTASLAAPGEDVMSAEEQLQRQQFAEQVVGPEMAAKVLLNTADQGPVFTLHLQDGRVIEWLEPSYGKLMLTESVTEQGFMDEIREASPTTASKAFALFQPGAPVPEVLQAFDARIAEMVPVYQALRAARREQSPTDWNADAAEATDVLAADSEFAQTEQALTKEVNQGQSTEAGFVSLCNGLYPNVSFGSPGNKIKKQDINGGVGLGYGKKGTIKVQVKVRQWWDWAQVYYENVPQGWWKGVYMFDDYVDFDMETAVYTDSGEKAKSCLAWP